MKRRDFIERFEASVNCEFQAIPMAVFYGVAAVATVASATVGIVSSIQAANQASAIANYNYQVQMQNAQVAYAMQVQQSQYAQQAANANIMLAQANQQYAQTQAAYARAKYDVQLQNAKQYEDQANAVRAQQREEARRIREEGDRRQGLIIAKYGASGVTFEGSPLVVLADEARLTSAQVQDAAYVKELEARKQFRAADITRFEAEFTKLEEFGALMQGYGAQVEQTNYQNALESARYDTLIAGVRNRIALNAADLALYEGEAQAGQYRMSAISSGIGAVGSLASLGISYGGTTGAAGATSLLSRTGSSGSAYSTPNLFTYRPGYYH